MQMFVFLPSQVKAWAVDIYTVLNMFSAFCMSSSDPVLQRRLASLWFFKFVKNQIKSRDIDALCSTHRVQHEQARDYRWTRDMSFSLRIFLLFYEIFEDYEEATEVILIESKTFPSI